MAMRDLAVSIRSSGPLPSAGDLVINPALEAAALKALDLCAPRRLVAVTHCDDTIYLASSWGEMCLILAEVSEWCWETKSELHVGPDKTVAMVLGGELLQADASAVPVLHLPMRGTHDPRECVPLTQVRVHRWLGVLWLADLDFSPLLFDRISCARSAFAELPGLAACKALPLSVALELFEAKVDGVLDFGRWLFLLVPGASRVLDVLLQEWARALLGAEPWRNPAVAMSELGWVLSGSSRALLSMAMRRARLLLPDTGFLYKDVSVLSAALHCPLSWLARSAVILQEANVPCTLDKAGVSVSVSAYASSAKAALVSRDSSWFSETLDKHGATVPYTVFQQGTSQHVHGAKLCGASWAVQLCIRSWCRFRAGLVVLAQKDGKASTAKFQDCIFCGDVVRNAVVHCLSRCRRWSGRRDEIVVVAALPDTLSKDELARAILACVPGDAAFELVVAWFDQIDAASSALVR